MKDPLEGDWVKATDEQGAERVGRIVRVGDVTERQPDGSHKVTIPVALDVAWQDGTVSNSITPEGLERTEEP